MLQSGQWTANSDGSLSRVKKETPATLGFPSKERISELENLDRELTESEAREYASESFNPSSNPNILFSLAAGAGFDPVGDAVMKGVRAIGRKSLGKGVSAMKSTPSNLSRFEPGGDPNKSNEAGVRFVKDFYSDPYVDRHFTDIYGEGSEVKKTFSRGRDPVTPRTDVDLRRKYKAEGLYSPKHDETYVDRFYFSDKGQNIAGLENKVKGISTHETAHYADAPMFTPESKSVGAGMDLQYHLDQISNSLPTEKFSSYYPSNPSQPYQKSSTGSRDYWGYLTDPQEMTANAMNLRRDIESVIFENTNPNLFKNIGDDESFSKIMVGDFSDLSDIEFKALMSKAYTNSDQHTQNTLRHVLKGANDKGTFDFSSGKVWDDAEKKASISDWLKYALMVPVAGTAASQVEMIDGGKVKVLKR